MLLDETSKTVAGDAGNDNLFGDAGDDLLWGSRGSDTLVGGAGKDTFFYSSQDIDRADVIRDFSPGEDLLHLQGLFRSMESENPIADGLMRVVRVGSSTAIQINSNPGQAQATFRTLVTLNNVAPTDLQLGTHVFMGR